MTPFRTESLANGVRVAFFDHSNRYFGDYHRVCVEVHITLASGTADAGSQASRPQRICRLERMAVAGAEVAAVRQRLVDDYWQHAGRYLAHPAWPARFASESAKPGRQRPGLRLGE